MKLPSALGSSLSTSGKPWISIDFAKFAGIPGLDSLESNPMSSNPGEMLQYLKGVSGSVVSEGQQSVDGVEASHYHADLDLDRVAAALPSVDRQAVQQLLS